MVAEREKGRERKEEKKEFNRRESIFPKRNTQLVVMGHMCNEQYRLL